MSEGILARAASSMSAFAMTVFPDPVEPSMAAWRARTIDLISIGSPVSLRFPKYIPFGLYRFDLLAAFGAAMASGERISSTRAARLGSSGEAGSAEKPSSEDTITGRKAAGVLKTATTRGAEKQTQGGRAIRQRYGAHTDRPPHLDASDACRCCCRA